MTFNFMKFLKVSQHRIANWLFTRDQGRNKLAPPCHTVKSEKAVEQGFQAQVELTAKKLAMARISGGYNYKGMPGPITLNVWETKLISKTGRWKVVDGWAFDLLRDLLKEAVGTKRLEVNQKDLSPLLERFNDMAENLIGQGSGPAAPTFDSHDRDTESERGG